ncbi:MAG: SDR family oxidoreductase [Microthrixaceae bacterium]|nr:SDR family oxidoreductase [Microthrixaceae bacterium]
MNDRPSTPDGLFDVTAKHVVVTGGSRGIGLMIARGFLRAGADVLISARKSDQLAAAAADLSTDGEVHTVVADVSTAAGAQALAEAVRLWSDRLHVLVNNAGATWGAPIEAFPEDGFDKVMDTNVKGPFYLTSALLPELRAAGSPEDPARVINIGSVDGMRPPLLESYPYSASKAAIHQLTHHLALRLASEHIAVNAIAPGPFESKMMAFALSDPSTRSAVERTVPLGRIGRPDDMAGTAIFLSSRAGAYLTGAVIPVDGGITGA